jgi:hypothetical protein
MSEGVSDDDAAVADAMMGKRTKETTKDCYSWCIRDALLWFRIKRPDCLTADGSEFRIPIPIDALHEFFGHMCSVAHKLSKLPPGSSADPEDPDPPAFTTVNNYKSALLDLYKGQDITIPAETRSRLGQILDGYNKQLNELRRRGLVALTEGKRELSFSGFLMLAKKLCRRILLTDTWEAPWRLLCLCGHTFCSAGICSAGANRWREQVRPYSHIPRCDLKPKDHINHRRAKVVAQYLEQQVLKAEPRLLPEGVRQIRQLRPADNDRIFEVVYDR